MIAVISDVHANADALKAVLAELEKADLEHTICLGDLVGYNTQVSDTLTLVRDAKIPSVHGNHDLMVLGRIETDGCGSWAARAVQWTQSVISAEERRYLASLPGAYRLRHDLLFVHSGLGDPVRRLQSPYEYVQQFRLLRYFDPALRICFTGHTHVATIVEVSRDEHARLRTEERVDLRDDCFYFVNPGSVGHPRGEDKRASYALYDTTAERVTLRRVAYKSNRVQRENAKHGLPPSPQSTDGVGAPARESSPLRNLVQRFALMGK